MARMNLPSLHITPQILVDVYTMLRRTPPFRKWDLPEADDVIFEVTRASDRRGSCKLDQKSRRWKITVSTVCVGDWIELIPLVGHEMVHIKCDREGSRTNHGAEFRAAAAEVCRHHAFQFKQFV
jgi:hypothetical protein